MGRKLANHLGQAGCRVVRTLTLADQEFSFNGPASPGVVEAWDNRLNRMTLLRDYCGPEFERVRQEFLDCIIRPDHCSRATVHCCIALG